MAANSGGFLSNGLVAAVFTMIGFIIGAGILGIPFVVAKAGFLTGLVMILLIGGVMMLVNLYVGEVNLRTHLNHQLTGLTKIYLGRLGWAFMLFSVMFGMYGAIIAYIIEEGNFLSALFSPIIAVPAWAYSLAFFAVFAVFVHLGLEWIEKSEVIIGIVLGAVLLAIIVFTAPHVDVSNLTGFSPSKLLVPFGVVLFAFLGTASIPEVREELKGQKHKMLRAILIGSAIPIAVYVLFALLVVGVTGISTTESAMLGLQEFLGYKAVLFGLLFGTFTMATSFLAVGLALKEVYMLDFQFKEGAATSLALFIPLALAAAVIAMGVGNAFYTIINISGALAGGIDIILIVLMHWKAKQLSQREPEYSIPKSVPLGVLLIIIAIAGIAYGILSTVGIV